MLQTSIVNRVFVLLKAEIETIVLGNMATYIIDPYVVLLACLFSVFATYTQLVANHREWSIRESFSGLFPIKSLD